MEIYVDIADLETIKMILEYFPIDGFTTNPKILACSQESMNEIMPKYKTFIEEEKLMIFFQVTGKTAEQMFAQAVSLHDYFGDNFIVKIPAVKEGYKAVRMCKAAGIKVLVTIVHSVMQALIAAKAGADYVAPYVSHIDNLGADGIRTVTQMVTLLEKGGYSCKVLGASFRTVDQIQRLAITGCQAITIKPEMFNMLINHPSTNESMKNFYDIWETKFGNKQIDDLLPEQK